MRIHNATNTGTKVLHTTLQVDRKTEMEMEGKDVAMAAQLGFCTIILPQNVCRQPLHDVLAFPEELMLGYHGTWTEHNRCSLYVKNRKVRWDVRSLGFAYEHAQSTSKCWNYP